MLANPHIGFPPVIVSRCKFRVELDGFAEVPNRLLVVAKAPIGIPPTVIAPAYFGLSSMALVQSSIARLYWPRLP